MCAKAGERIRDEMSDRIIETAKHLAVTVGAEKLNVRMILGEMGITNRVFYNRFNNIEEVLNIVYQDTVVRIRASIVERLDPEGDLIEQVMDIVTDTLRLSYRHKKYFNQYVFENDSVSKENYAWWKEQIIRLIELGKTRGYVRELDAEIMAYAIWCFIRGYNADALGRGLPIETAIENFRYSFRVLLDGMKP